MYHMMVLIMISDLCKCDICSTEAITLTCSILEIGINFSTLAGLISSGSVKCTCMHVRDITSHTHTIKTMIILKNHLANKADLAYL